VRIGHFVEAQILEAIEVDYIDESEVLTMADEENHINKNNFNVRSVGDDVINDGVMHASIIVVTIVHPIIIIIITIMTSFTGPFCLWLS